MIVLNNVPSVCIYELFELNRLDWLTKNCSTYLNTIILLAHSHYSAHKTLLKDLSLATAHSFPFYLAANPFLSLLSILGASLKILSVNRSEILSGCNSCANLESLPRSLG